MRDKKGLRGPCFYSSAKTFLPTALECCWDMSRPCREVAMGFMRSDLGSRACVSVAVAGVRAAHLETPWPDGLVDTPQPGSGQAPWLRSRRFPDSFPVTRQKSFLWDRQKNPETSSGRYRPWAVWILQCKTWNGTNATETK